MSIAGVGGGIKTSPSQDTVLATNSHEAGPKPRDFKLIGPLTDIFQDQNEKYRSSGPCFSDLSIQDIAQPKAAENGPKTGPITVSAGNEQDVFRKADDARKTEKCRRSAILFIPKVAERSTHVASSGSMCRKVRHLSSVNTCHHT